MTGCILTAGVLTVFCPLSFVVYKYHEGALSGGDVELWSGCFDSCGTLHHRDVDVRIPHSAG